MSTVKLGVLLLLMSAGVGTAWAFPSGFSHVDPKAPCFRWPAVDMDGDGVFDRVDNCVSTPPGCTVDQYGCHSDTDGDGVCDGVDRCPGTAAGSEVDDHGCATSQGGASGARSAPTPAPTQSTPPSPAPAPAESQPRLDSAGRMRLENVLFESGTANMLPESEPALNELGRALERYPDVRIEVEGHTDTRGPADNNLRLSQARAETVRSYLIKHFNVGEDRVRAKGYGETRPETRERNEEELLRNRRVEIQVLNPEVLPSNVRPRN